MQGHQNICLKICKKLSQNLHHGLFCQNLHQVVPCRFVFLGMEILAIQIVSSNNIPSVQTQIQDHKLILQNIKTLLQQLNAADGLYMDYSSLDQCLLQLEQFPNDQTVDDLQRILINLCNTSFVTLKDLTACLPQSKKHAIQKCFAHFH